MIAQIVEIFKLRIGVFMALTALAGYAVTPGLALTPAQLALLALLVFAASGAAGAFNEFMERDLDALMQRTRSRPFVTGDAEAGPIWLALIGAILALSVGTSVWLFNAAVGLHLFLGAFFYGVVYTLWLKRRSVWNIVIGGAAGSFAVLAGASAATPHTGPLAILLAVVLFLWTPPHFWSLAIAMRDDYAAAGVPMLPVVKGNAATARVILWNTLLLVAVTVAAIFYGLGLIYLIGALVGGAWFIVKAYALTQTPDRSHALQCFFASLGQLVILTSAAIVDVYAFIPLF